MEVWDSRLNDPGTIEWRPSRVDAAAPGTWKPNLLHPLRTASPADDDAAGWVGH